MRRLIVILFCSIGTCTVFSQQLESNTSTEFFVESLTTPVHDKGSITIIQDARIGQLLANHIAINELNDGKIPGWRIQIYNSSGADSRKEAQEIRTKFIEKYPEMNAYVIYQPPFFKIRVGDFRTREEAYMVYKQIVKEFPVSYLVNDNIVLPKL